MMGLKLIALVVLMTVCSISITSSYPEKRESYEVMTEQLMNLLLEAKRREYLYNVFNAYQLENAKRDMHDFYDNYNNDDNFERTILRRKVVGIADNPF